jgi:hypothetical protein
MIASWISAGMVKGLSSGFSAHAHQIEGVFVGHQNVYAVFLA